MMLVLNDLNYCDYVCVCQRAWTYNVIVCMLYVNDMLWDVIVWSNWGGGEYPIGD